MLAHTMKIKIYCAMKETIIFALICSTNIPKRINNTMIYSIVRFLFVVLVFWLASCSPSRQQAETYYEQALALSKSNKDTAAIGLLEKAVKLDADYFQAWYALGTIYYHSDQYYKAADAFDHAVKLEEDDFLSHNYCGLSNARVGKYQDAISHFEKAISVCPDTLLPGETHTNLAASLVQIGEINKALDYYKSGLDILVRSANEKDRALVPATYYDAANTLAGAGALQSAIPLYSMAIAIKPNFKEAINFLALTHFNMGALDSAEVYWLKAIAVDSGYPAPYGGLSKIRKLQKKSWEANNFLGLQEAYKGNMNIAYNHFQNALFGNPNFTAAYYNLGLSCALLGKYDLALTNLKKAHNIMAQSPLPAAALSFLFAKQHKDKEAEQWKRISDATQKANAIPPIEKSFMF